MSQRRKKRFRRNPKVEKMNRVVKMNGAVVIFVVILFYVVASLIKSSGKTTITTYKVSSSNINHNITASGVALRTETEVKSTQSGYMIYFVRDGEKVSKGTPVCTVDSTGNVISSIQESGENEEGNTLFTDADYSDIRETIDTYKTSYTDVQFSNLYNFKSQIESKVMELASEAMMDQIETGGTSVSSTLESIVAPESGAVTYFTDGYENKTPDNLTKSDFNQANYRKTSLKSGDIMNTGSTVFKICTDENWKIVCDITEEQANTLYDRNSSTLRFTVNQEPMEFTAKYDLIRRSDGYSLVLMMDKYMIDFINDRFLSVEIILDRYEGLKVPNSALVEKETYKIPLTSAATSTDASSVSVSVRRTDENGNTVTVSVSPVIYTEDDSCYYVDESDFQETDVLVPADGSQQVPVLSLERAKVTGVYLANEGVAEFTEVTVRKKEDEFSIIQSGESLKEFDNIVLDASSVSENQTLY